MVASAAQEVVRVVRVVWLVVVGLYGALAGSYLGVVVDRLPAGRGLAQPSCCRACGAPVRRRDNVPLLAYVLLRGRCRDCAARIPVGWWLLEGVVAVSWVAAGAVADVRLWLVVVLVGCWLVALAGGLTLLVGGRASGVRRAAWGAAVVPPVGLAVQVVALGAAGRGEWGPFVVLAAAGFVLLGVSVVLTPRPDPVLAAASG